MNIVTRLDGFMLRVLRVTPQPITDTGRTGASEARSVSLALVISGVRCVLQYVVLPVVLPLIGLWGGFSLLIVLLLDLLALWLLINSLRYFWRVQHPRRFDMLPLFGAIFLIIVSALAYDCWTLLR